MRGLVFLFGWLGIWIDYLAILFTREAGRNIFEKVELWHNTVSFQYTKRRMTCFLPYSSSQRTSVKSTSILSAKA